MQENNQKHFFEIKQSNIGENEVTYVDQNNLHIRKF